MKSRLFLLPLLTLIALISTAVYAPEKTEKAAEQPNIEVTTSSVLAPTAIKKSAPAPAAAPLISPEAISPDTLPEGRHQVSTYRNGKSTKFLVEDRAIKELEIDGKVIPEAEFDQHEAMVERMLGANKTSRSNVMILRDGDWDEADGPFRYKLHSLDQLDGWQGFDSIGFESIEELKKLKSLENLEFLDLENLENLEYMGEEWEDLGERLGTMGEKIGRSFKGMFDSDGSVMRFHWNSEDGEPFLFDSDSIPAGTIFKYRSGDDVIIRSDKMEFDGESSEAKIREMETMIEKLERRKEAMRREMEEVREQQGELSEEQREMRDRARALVDEQRARRDGQRRRATVIRKEQREVAERLRAEARRERGADYDSILEQLQSEGLIESSGPLKKLSVDNKALKINGTKASTEAHQRFLELYQKRTGKSPGEKFAIKVTKS